MQPDPSAFLRGIRHETLNCGRASLAENDFVRGVTLLRASEILAHLTLRHESLPALLRQIQPRLAALLQTSAEQMQSFGLALPQAAMALLQDGPVSAADAVIAHHDRLIAAQSECLLALQQSENPMATRCADRLMIEACGLMQDFYHARDEMLASIRADDSARLAPGEDKVPTAQSVTAYLRAHFPQYPQIRARELHRLKGFNTKEVYLLELHGHPDWPRQAVMRRNREVDTVGNKVSSEFGILDFLYRRGIPVPRPLFADLALDDVQRPFIVMERLPGRSMSPSELGATTAPVMRDLAANLARLHQVDVAELSDEYRPYGAPAPVRTRRMLDRFYALWQNDKHESSLVLESVYIWLRRNAGIIDDTHCVVHADYNLRNNLIDNGRISGMLDWELAHEGHPAEDLGYVRPQVEEVMPWPEFLQTYHACGGPAVSDAQVRYFQIYGLAFGMSTMFPACNGFIIGRHTDLLMGTAGTIEYGAYEALLSRLLLEEIDRRNPGEKTRS